MLEGTNATNNVSAQPPVASSPNPMGDQVHAKKRKIMDDMLEALEMAEEICERMSNRGYATKDYAPMIAAKLYDEFNKS